ncbi:TetR/AcrR family transcriptional regulator [Amycolatopsis acidicola]|uniref:TetR/AcrR family transcriptional regulator n=1 Tax=Amycolatopsis acidicola TaxID=2596893 RepID=A0A5N0UXM9_9PSEU|nr:TetR/AcrR family transcriptional regulator [Amycolatopsis acidicola]KAA9157104.1 TetR/AcrR family transcriptional regulator [Amycolatopsis acidicola]
MAGRRSDTRERIQQIALELFVEQGYEKTSLREIAERLDVTKAALYYHFRTKEDIVASLLDDLAESLDEVLEWGKAQEDHVGARRELIRRLAELVEGKFGPIMRFMQENQPALKTTFHERNPLVSRMKDVFQLLVADEQDPAAQLRARLSLVALVFGNSPQFRDENGGVPPEVALEVALDLVSPRGHRPGAAT